MRIGREYEPTARAPAKTFQFCAVAALTRQVAVFKRRATTNKLLAVVCALGFAVLPLDASARTHSAILGNPNDSADATCFDDINQGIINVCTGPRTWSVPIIWDTTTALGPKTVIVNSQFAPGGALSCTYRGFTANGSLFLTIPFPAFSAANPSRSIAVNNVPASSFGHVSCTMSPFSTVLLASVNYAPQ